MSPRFMVSPAERHPAILALGPCSAAPEKHGVDVMWMSERARGPVGVQRKEWKDLLASVGDGRLGREIHQMEPLCWRGLFIEGMPRFTTEGGLLGEWSGRWTRVGWRNLIARLQTLGLVVDWTDDEADTARRVEEIAAWLDKGETGLFRRPGPVGAWGTVSNEDWQVHLLEGIPGVGTVRAKAIRDHFDGVPLVWTVGRKALVKVPGLGKVTVERMVKAIPVVGGEP